VEYQAEWRAVHEWDQSLVCVLLVFFWDMLLTFRSYASDIANRLLGYIGDGCGKDGAEGWQ
jgi:hypothetical protein